MTTGNACDRHCLGRARIAVHNRKKTGRKQATGATSACRTAVRKAFGRLCRISRFARARSQAAPSPGATANAGAASRISRCQTARADPAAHGGARRRLRVAALFILHSTPPRRARTGPAF